MGSAAQDDHRSYRREASRVAKEHFGERTAHRVRWGLLVVACSLALGALFGDYLGEARGAVLGAIGALLLAALIDFLYRRFFSAPAAIYADQEQRARDLTSDRDNYRNEYRLAIEVDRLAQLSSEGSRLGIGDRYNRLDAILDEITEAVDRGDFSRASQVPRLAAAFRPLIQTVPASGSVIQKQKHKQLDDLLIKVALYLDQIVKPQS